MLGGIGAAPRRARNDRVAEFMDQVYAWCALAYKWKPDEVDEIPLDRLMSIIEINNGWIREIIGSISRSIPKT